MNSSVTLGLPLDEDEAAAPPPERTGSRKETAYQICRNLILENIEYDTLIQNPRIDREQLDEIVDILLETVCTSRKSIRVAGDDFYNFLVAHDMAQPDWGRPPNI